MARTVKSKTSSDAPVESAPVVNAAAAAPVKAPKVVKKAKAPVESAPVEMPPLLRLIPLRHPSLSSPPSSMLSSSSSLLLSLP